MDSKVVYGEGDSTFRAAGGQSGARALVDTFYDVMKTDPAFADIWAMHTQDEQTIRHKLYLFLCSWMGGPSEYAKTYGPINIPRVHQHLDISAHERDQWLKCMSKALSAQDYPDSLVKYLQVQLAIPAERIRIVCERRHRSAESETPCN